MTIFLTPKNKKYKCNKVTMTIGTVFYSQTALFVQFHKDFHSKQRFFQKFFVYLCTICKIII